jgi:hypothetical protein
MPHDCREGVHVYHNSNKEVVPVEITHTIKIDKPKPPPPPAKPPILLIVLLIYAVLILFAGMNQYRLIPQDSCDTGVFDCPPRGEFLPN